MELNKFVVDTVRLVEDQDGNPGIQVVRYLVVSDTAQNAFKRFQEGDDFPIYEQSEMADRIIIGIGLPD